MAIPVIDLSTGKGTAALEKVLNRLRHTTSAGSDAALAVARIIADVAAEGDKAVVKYMRQWTDPSFRAERIRVSRRELDESLRNLSTDLRKALERSIAHVSEYQKHIMPRAPKPVVIDGATLGMRLSPVDSAGLAVPGGKAAYPSSVVMLAVPAIVAGVPGDKVSVVTPPPTRAPGTSGSDVSPLVLATCAMLGIEKVYRIGGAQAIAALAHGTESVEKVDLVAGPGNVYVQLAKAQLSGVIGTDNGFYGPSEVLTIADASADPKRIAADLIAQAEHDPGKCFLVSWSRLIVRKIAAEVEKQKAQRRRLEAIDKALTHESAMVIVRDRKQAVELANTIAAEHVNLAVSDPVKLLEEVRHGGEFFLGDQTPVAAGDYYAGPSHCLPTATTARFTSGVSAYTFLKRSGTVWYSKGMSSRTIDDIAKLADAEGLDGHAASARVRGK